MERDEIESRVVAIVADVFAVSPAKLSPATDLYSGLRAVNGFPRTVLACEAEFGVRIEGDPSEQFTLGWLVDRIDDALNGAKTIWPPPPAG
jgi:acyl carrier protein